MYRRWHVQGGLFLCSIIIPVWLFIAEGFVLERKEKKVPSVSTMVLREQCAQGMGDMLQMIADIMHELANIQSADLTHIGAFFNGEKKCFLLSAKKDQLYDLQIKLTVHKQHLAMIKQTLQEQVLFLQSLEPKKSKNNRSAESSV